MSKLQKTSANANRKGGKAGKGGSVIRQKDSDRSKDPDYTNDHDFLESAQGEIDNESLIGEEFGEEEPQEEEISDADIPYAATMVPELFVFVKQFKKRLKERRKAAKLSLRAAAKRAKMAFSTWYTYERLQDARVPALIDLWVVAKVSNTSVAYLLGATNDPRPNAELISAFAGTNPMGTHIGSPQALPKGSVPNQALPSQALNQSLVTVPLDLNSAQGYDELEVLKQEYELNRKQAELLQEIRRVQMERARKDHRTGS